MKLRIHSNTGTSAPARSAFTLMELTVVLAIGAMLAGVAVLSLRGPYGAAKLAAAVEQVESFDQVVRSHARRTGRSAELTIDLNSGTLTAAEPRPGQPVRRVVLDPGLRIDRVELTHKRVSQDKVTVSVFEQGNSPTYAIRLRGSGKQIQWIVFAGITGQSMKVSDEKQLQVLFEELSPRRADSD